jgi:hypothetical protein
MDSLTRNSRHQQAPGTSVSHIRRTASWHQRAQIEISSRGKRVTPIFRVGQLGTQLKHYPQGREKISSALAAFKTWCLLRGVPWDVENGSRGWSQR